MPEGFIYQLQSAKAGGMKRSLSYQTSLLRRQIGCVINLLKLRNYRQKGYFQFISLLMRLGIKRPPCRFWVHKDTPPELSPKVEPGFKVQPRRWVVERTFAWINRNRRLSKEYDLLIPTLTNN